MKKVFLAIALFSFFGLSLHSASYGTKRYRERPTTPTHPKTLADVKEIMTKKGISAKKRFALLIKIVRETIPEEDISDGLKVILKKTDLIKKKKIIFKPSLVQQILIETGWRKDIESLSKEESSDASDSESSEDSDSSESDRNRSTTGLAAVWEFRRIANR